MEGWYIADGFVEGLDVYVYIYIIIYIYIKLFFSQSAQEMVPCEDLSRHENVSKFFVPFPFFARSLPFSLSCVSQVSMLADGLLAGQGTLQRQACWRHVWTRRLKHGRNIKGHPVSGQSSLQEAGQDVSGVMAVVRNASESCVHC